MTDLERLDQTISQTEQAVTESDMLPQERARALFYVGVLQFLRGVLATEVKERAD